GGGDWRRPLEWLTADDGEGAAGSAPRERQERIAVRHRAMLGVANPAPTERRPPRYVREAALRGGGPSDAAPACSAYGVTHAVEHGSIDQRRLPRPVDGQSSVGARRVATDARRSDEPERGIVRTSGHYTHVSAAPSALSALMAGPDGRVIDVACALLLFTAVLVYLLLLPRHLQVGDESYFLYEAKRIRDGEVMYRDIFQFV